MAVLHMEEQLEAKKKELEALKKITALTDEMKVQLEELSGQIRQMNSNAASVSQVLENWNSITRSISLAGLSLLQYAEGDYEVGVWKSESKNKDEEPVDGHGPLPETLVRIRMNEKN
ncbi:DAD2 (YKR083C) [Zygosaccharomyces parabailii]|uniref:DASH complex subunit DAD2 n=1 Tax=Zygosaccharomyces bailii (strain CLIB 213 / ATCC 58445 / CBS 680 / BCRC 21525 / NBRC 1098 / NCYC 1416 / NRRL Y-2227) TaxID=1333698 RepID=A0A8J2T3D9_ZYGB2|nr:DAD2 (YKR083C) [Zygosaccharomyces parabailii]CDF87197.1 BN860_00980g1_1 [Zygosaccharomyces bailii CLIB 213]CDH15738.1 related to DASH complex subunit DAD2 [Zygosaccharomyces bailii ISA1307]SJM88200.1 related to DASH complex subunit DAD2 [Zygosaccharomyces bailii]